MEQDKKNYRVAYTIIERNQRKRWVRIGAAFDNRDGSINVLLDAVPTNGTIQLRDWVPEEHRNTALQSNRAQTLDDERVIRPQTALAS